MSTGTSGPSPAVVYLSPDPQPLGQRRRQQQPGRPGDRLLVVDGDIALVHTTWEDDIEEGVFRLGAQDRLAAVMLPGQEAVSIVPPRPRRT